MKKLTLLVFLIIGVSSLSKGQNYQLTSDKVKIIEDLVTDGYMKFDYELQKAYIKPSIWNSWNVDQKELVTIYFAMYIRNKNRGGDEQPVVDVYDYMSGKRIAGYGYFGFKIYD